MALRTFSEIKTRLFQWTGLNSDDTDHIEIVEQAINDTYEDVLSRHDWRLLLQEGSFNTIATYSTGTVSSSGATLTGVGTTWAAEMEGRYISFGTFRQEVRKIITFASTTSLVLDQAPAVAVTAASYRIFQSDYSLADGVDENTIRYMIDTHDSRKIDPLPMDLIEDYWPNQGTLTEGIPYYYSFVGRDDQLATIIRLYPIPNEVRPIKYAASDIVGDLADDTAIPIIYEKFQNIIDQGAKAMIFEWMGKAEKSAKCEARCERMIARMWAKEQGNSTHVYTMKNDYDSRKRYRGLRLPGNYPDRIY